MDNTTGKSYETPSVIASLDALGMITDADGLGAAVCSSNCEIHAAAPRAVPANSSQ